MLVACYNLGIWISTSNDVGNNTCNICPLQRKRTKEILLMGARIIVEINDEEDITRSNIEAEAMTNLELRALVGELESLKCHLIKILHSQTIEIEETESDDR